MAELRNIDRVAVMKALAEYDRLGSKKFLDKHGYKPATKYHILHAGRLYPSKAIIGVASGIASGVPQENDFSGGLHRVVRKLKSLGFEVVEPAKNPVWSEDELILALQLYLTNPSSPPRKESKEVRTLSNILNKLHQIMGTDAGITLRNENGVYLKMMNFRAIDPDFVAAGKAGMKAGGKLEKTVWEKYAGDKKALSAEAERIKEAICIWMVQTCRRLPKGRNFRII